VLDLTTGTFANANAVVSALHSPAYTFDLTNGTGAALAAHFSDRMLVACQDLSGNTRVMD